MVVCSTKTRVFDSPRLGKSRLSPMYPINSLRRIEYIYLVGTKFTENFKMVAFYVVLDYKNAVEYVRPRITCKRKSVFDLFCYVSEILRISVGTG